MENNIPTISADVREQEEKKSHSGSMQLKRYLGLASFLFLALALPSVLVLTQNRQTVEQQASTGTSVTPLGFGSQIGVDGAAWRCKMGPNANDEFHTGHDQSFSGDIYRRCKDQFFSDIDYLGRNNVKSFRLFTYLSQYAWNSSTNSWGNLNDNIKNLDEILARFALNGIKVHVVVGNVYFCGQTYAKGFDYNFFTNPTLGQQYLNSLQQFVSYYKNNTTIVSYDLLNEVNSLIQTDYLNNSINKPTSCMNASREQIKGFLAQMYTTSKTADAQLRAPGIHKFTFSLSLMKEAVKDNYLSLIRDISDIYDIHMYVGRSQYDNPDNYFKDYPVLDKPVIHGEIGFLAEADTTLLDSNGQKCDSYNFEPGYPREASYECQERLLFNTKTWIEKARQKGSDTLFFQNFHSTNRFFFRTYYLDSVINLWKTSAYKPTLSGNYIISQNSLGCTTRDCSLVTNIPSPTSLVPTITPNYSVAPPAPTNSRAGLITSTSIQLLWNDVSGNETFFRVAYTPNVSPQTWKTAIVSQNTTQYTFTGLIPGTQYHLGVQACNGDQNITSSQKCSSYVTTPLISTLSTITQAPTILPTYTPTPTICIGRGCPVLNVTPTRTTSFEPIR